MSARRVLFAAQDPHVEKCRVSSTAASDGSPCPSTFTDPLRSGPNPIITIDPKDNGRDFTPRFNYYDLDVYCLPVILCCHTWLLLLHSYWKLEKRHNFKYSILEGMRLDFWAHSDSKYRTTIPRGQLLVRLERSYCIWRICFKLTEKAMAKLFYRCPYTFELEPVNRFKYTVVKIPNFQTWLTWGRIDKNLKEEFAQLRATVCKSM